jgi:hypothetical protein
MASHFSYVKAREQMDPTIASLEYLRMRLRNLIAGDYTVDLGSLVDQLNKDIGSLGGQKVRLSPEEIKPHYFVRDSSIESLDVNS